MMHLIVIEIYKISFCLTLKFKNFFRRFSKYNLIYATSVYRLIVGRLMIFFDDPFLI